MAGNLKGLTIEIGGDTTGLDKALKSVNSKARSLSGELGEVNKLLKLDPGNTELLAQKQEILADAIANTKEKLDTLKAAEQQVQAQFERGEASTDQVRALQREIIDTEQKLGAYERAAQETADALDNAGEQSKQAAKETDKFREASDAAEASSGRLGDTLGQKVKIGLAAVAAGVAAATAALLSSVEATHAYRTEIGKLETAYMASGHSAESARTTYEELQSVLGDTDQAVEAANHMAKMTDSAEDLARWTEVCTGIYAAFGASLPVEGLAEAANETARVGKVTGPLADALNWAAEAGETFGVALKENTKDNEAWNEAVMEATTAEEFFNLALSACTDEQERQKLILETMYGLYGETADIYRETNAEVIASNRLTERQNRLWADVAKKALPVVNTFKEGVLELGESLVAMVSDADIEKFQDTVSRGFQKLTRDVLPKLIDVLGWCADHFDILQSAAAGFLAALAVNKVTKFASSVSSTLIGAFKSLVGSVKAATTAQQGMNAAASANPYILLAEVVIGLATAIGTYLAGELEAAKDRGAALAEEMYGLSDAEQAAADSANAAAEAFKTQQSATDDSMAAIVSQFSYVESLKEELLSLADASGQVDEANRTRAEFILGQLNSALGTEYTMTETQIDGYQTLAGEIDNVIDKKRAELLLTGSEDAYVAALQGKQEAEKAYYTNLAAYHETEMAYISAQRELETLEQERRETNFIWEHMAMNQRIAEKEGELETLKGILDETGTAYENNKETLAGYYDAIGQYETAQMLMLSGNTEEAARVLADRSYYQKQYAAEVGYASDEVLNTLEQEAVEAGLKAELFRENWENGVEGFTEEMVHEAEEGYRQTIEALADGYADAEAAGQDITAGLRQGMESGRGGLIQKAYDIVSSTIAAFRRAADSHSPSRKMIAFGEDLGEGSVIGLENRTKPLVKTAKDQIQALFSAYQDMADKLFRSTPAITPQILRGSTAVEDGQVADYRPASVTQNNYYTTKELSPYELYQQQQRASRVLAAELAKV